MMIIGIFLCTLPLYAEFFTKELMDSHIEPDTSEGYNSMHGLYAVANQNTESYTMMYVSPWCPFIGGILALVGGVVIGRSISGSVISGQSRKTESS